MIGTTILIVDDHRLFADVVGSALEQLGARIVGPVGTVADAIEAAERERPDLVLLDLGLPDGTGFDAGRAILASHPGIAVVALTASTDPRAATEAVRAGFKGFVPKDARIASVISAISGALDGRVVVIRPSRNVGQRSTTNGSATPPLTTGLTRREHEILALIVGGAGSRAIADRLQISTNTVRTHVQSVLTKLQVHSRLEAAAFAIRHGLVEPETRLGTRRDVGGDGPLVREA
jgi:two-component system nitrate/nitrite response regulator NarL